MASFPCDNLTLYLSHQALQNITIYNIQVGHVTISITNCNSGIAPILYVYFSKLGENVIQQDWFMLRHLIQSEGVKFRSNECKDANDIYSR